LGTVCSFFESLFQCFRFSFQTQRLAIIRHQVKSSY
jgi:hypothetical protein